MKCTSKIGDLHLLQTGTTTNLLLGVLRRGRQRNLDGLISLVLAPELFLSVGRGRVGAALVHLAHYGPDGAP